MEYRPAHGPLVQTSASSTSHVFLSDPDLAVVTSGFTYLRHMDKLSFLNKPRGNYGISRFFLLPKNVKKGKGLTEVNGSGKNTNSDKIEWY